MLLIHKFGLVFFLVLTFGAAGSATFLFDEEGGGEGENAIWAITAPIAAESWIDTFEEIPVSGTKVKKEKGLTQFRVGNLAASVFSEYVDAAIDTLTANEWDTEFEKQSVHSKWPTPGTAPGFLHPYQIRLYGDTQVVDEDKLVPDPIPVTILAT